MFNRLSKMTGRLLIFVVFIKEFLLWNWDGILFSGLICLENICLMTVIDYIVNCELRKSLIIFYEDSLMYLLNYRKIFYGFNCLSFLSSLALIALKLCPRSRKVIVTHGTMPIANLMTRVRLPATCKMSI